MNFPFFIARRYLFSKKSTHAINIISVIRYQRDQFYLCDWCGCGYDGFGYRIERV